MMEIKELLKTLPAVSGSDFTIWKTESENYPYVLVVYSYYNEIDGKNTYQVRSGTTLGSFITGCALFSGSSSNSNYVMYDQRVYYYDNTTATWVLSSNSTKKGTVVKITIGDEVLQGSADTVIFSTRDIWTGNKDIGYKKDYRFLLSGRQRHDSPLGGVFTEEHLEQLGYEAGDHIVRLATNTYEALYVLKGVEDTSIAAGYSSSSSNYLSLTFPACQSIAGLRYAISSGAYTNITTCITQSSASLMIDDYVVFSTLDLTFNGRLMRLRDHYVTGVRDEILSIQPDSISFEELPTFTGQTSPEGLEIEAVIPFEDVINPDNIQESIILTFRAGNAYPYNHEILMVNPEILPESITATPATIEDFINTTHQLSVEVLPDEAEDKSVSFISDNNKVATVDETGLVTLKGEGETTLTISSVRVPDLSTQVVITAIRPYEKPVINRLSISPSSPTELDDVEFTYDVTYDRATFKAEEWENKQERYEAGRHTVRVRVQDSNDLWSDWKELSFNVAAVYQEPVISNLRMSPANPGYGEAVEFTYDYTLDPRLTLQKENWTNKKSSYLDGNHTVKLSITDSEGQTSNELTISFSIERPYDQPTISNLRMTPVNPQPGEEVSFSYDKNLDSRLQVKQENWTNKQSSYEAGVHTVKLSITDTADQTSNELSVTFSIEQPLEAPVIDNLRIDPATPNAGEKVSFIYDKVIDERLALKTENWQGKRETYEAGQHTVTLSITDSADQVSNTLSLTFEVAYVPEIPVLNSITMTPTTPIAGDAVNFTYQATLDPKATVQEEIWEGKLESYEAGDHEVALTLVDSFHQRSNRQTLAFTVLRRKDQPIISNLRMTPENPTTEDDITFTYDAVLDPELTLLSENWVNKQSSYEAGVHTVSLTITDSDHQVSNELSLTFEVVEPVEVPPVADLFPLIYDITVDPPQPRAGEVISYSYTVGLAAETSVETLKWHNRQLVFEEAGTYEVGLEVKDSRGIKTMKTIEVEVGEASETPQPPKPMRIKHLEVTRWDSASKRFLILEGREK